MDKLNHLLAGNVRDFATTFGAATRNWAEDASSAGCAVWLEGWVAPAQAGYVLGDGEFIHKGVPRRFYFSGMPLRHGQTTRLSGAGTISGLRTLLDFSGVYLPWEPAPSAARRAEGCLKNRRGVVITLISSDDGELVDLPYGGLRVRLATDL